MNLNKKSFALAGGILWSAGMFILTWLALLFDYGDGLMVWLQSAYLGYTVTPLGSVVGAVWGFANAFICLYVFAWLYNKLNSKG